MKHRPIDLFPKKIALTSALMVPLVVLTLLAMTILGYLAYQNSRKSVNIMAEKLRQEITGRIEDHLEIYLETPHKINRINAEAFLTGLIKPDDQTRLQFRFLEQVKLFDTVTSIYFGNTAGGLVNAGREGTEGSLYIIFTEDFKSGLFQKYQVDNAGKSTQLLMTLPDFDARTRPWYEKAVQRSSQVWSDPYILFTGQDMAISACQPVYDSRGTLIGVTAVDLFLSQLEKYLSELEIGTSGKSFIMETSGLLIASSSGEKPFQIREGEPLPDRITVLESIDPLISGSSQYLYKTFGSLSNLVSSTEFDFIHQGKRIFGKATPVNNSHGLDWVLVTVIPETDFLFLIKSGNSTTIELMIISTILIVLAIILLGKRITNRISKLHVAAEALAEGKWEHDFFSPSRIKEVDGLYASFKNMVEQLNQTFCSLQQEIIERKFVEQMLTNSLEEKEILLSEVHHRVKNNLNIISSLLNLQSSQVETPDQAVKSLEKSRDRIMSMAIVHQKLYQTRNFASINMADYLEDISSNLYNIYKSDSTIELKMETHELLLDIKTAIPCGMILNELLTNAFKYSFPKGKEGEIKVILAEKEDNLCELTIADNGLGIPPGSEDKGTLGLTMVKLLVEQINGTIEIKRREGTLIRIIFPKQPSNQRNSETAS